MELRKTPQPRRLGLMPPIRAENPCKSTKADARTRTGDPFITSEVLYQLSYVGNRPTVAASGLSTCPG